LLQQPALAAAWSESPRIVVSNKGHVKTVTESPSCSIQLRLESDHARGMIADASPFCCALVRPPDNQ